MNTKQAFEKLLSNQKLCDKAGFNPSTIRSYRKRLRDGELLSVKTMEEMLLKAGAKKVPEKWTFKKVKA